MSILKQMHRKLNMSSAMPDIQRLMISKSVQPSGSMPARFRELIYKTPAKKRKGLAGQVFGMFRKIPQDHPGWKRLDKTILGG